MHSPAEERCSAGAGTRQPAFAGPIERCRLSAGRCRDRGLEVPDQLSVTGSDDIELGNLVVPKLTTVHVPTIEIGMRAAKRIVALIDNAELPPEADLSTRLVLRGSLGRVEPEQSRAVRRHKSVADATSRNR
jgi:hypothetical protein